MPSSPGRFYGDFYGLFFGGSPATANEVTPTTPAVVTAAANRLAQQFKDKPKINAALAALVAPLQPVADAVTALILQQSIDAATDAQLDMLGSKIGEARAGLDDPSYRRRLRARVAVNRSDGTPEDMITVASLVIGVGSGAIVFPEQQRYATVDVHITNYIPDDDTVAALLEFLQEAASAGVRVLLEVLATTDDDTFTMATTETSLASDAHTSDTTISVLSTAGFPAKGSLDVDLGTTVAETVTYDGILATQFLNVSPLTQNHVGFSDGNGAACVQLTDDAGKGWGDDVDLTAGGEFADVVE